jgi:acetyltransferase-like isoleucine patch superfamily enzyme
VRYRDFFVSLMGKKGYEAVKHTVKKFLCLIRGVSQCGINAYISPYAVIKRGRRIKLGKNVVVERDVTLWVDTTESYIAIGDDSYLSSQCILNTFDGWISLGSNCSVNSYAILYGHGGLHIGDDVRIAPQVMIMPMNHIYRDPQVVIRKQGILARGVRIDDDVWLGAGAIILDGVTIGKGSIIGAGSVVTEEIPPYSVAVGVPAKVIKKRATFNKKVAPDDK